MTAIQSRTGTDGPVFRPLKKKENFKPPNFLNALLSKSTNLQECDARSCPSPHLLKFLIHLAFSVCEGVVLVS